MPTHPQTPVPGLRILTKKELQKKVPYTPQHILRLEKEGRFPKRLQLGPNRVGWVEHEVDSWIENLMRAREDDSQAVNAEEAEEGVANITDGEAPPGKDEPFITVKQLIEDSNIPARHIDWLEEMQRLPLRRTLPDGRTGWYASELSSLNQQQ